MAPGEFRGQGSEVRVLPVSVSILRTSHLLVTFSFVHFSSSGNLLMCSLCPVHLFSVSLLTGLSEAFTDPGQPQQVCQSN